MRGWGRLGAVALVCVVACEEKRDAPPADEPPFEEVPRPEVVVRADGNRDGTARLDDPADDVEGAIFLPNLDDDSRRCPVRTPSGSELGDLALAACHDAADAVVNGPDDERDLARVQVKPWPDAPPDVRARLRSSPSDRVRVFYRGPGSGGAFVPLAPGAELSDEDVRAGVELAVEGRDVIRDSTWDGLVDLLYEVRDATGAVLGSRRVSMRQAPLILSDHLAPAERVLAARTQQPGGAEFLSGLSNALARASTLEVLDLDDPWMQDLFEAGYVSMPAPDGVHSIRVLLRGPSVFQPDTEWPLRRTSAFLFGLRGKDLAVVQQFDPATPPKAQSLNGLGNLEVIPPYSSAGRDYPHGRMLIGATPAFHPDPSFTRMLEAQRVQPPIYVDTSWLLIGHVDEVFNVLPAPTARGWVLLVADPALARRMLEALVAEGSGHVPLFVGKRSLASDGVTELPAERTVAEVVADPAVTQASAVAAAMIEQQLQRVVAETGLTEAEIVRVPVLHLEVDGVSVAYQPNAVNGLVVRRGSYVAPIPHGPRIDGVDPFEAQLATTLGRFGYTVAWVEDWDLYHRRAGDVHCGTNALRELPARGWWLNGDP